MYLRIYILAFLLSLTATLQAQDKKALKESQAWQRNLNKEFKNPKESPLTAKDRAHFKKLEFYPINGEYIVWAILTPTPQEDTFAMKTTTERRPMYRKYGELKFELHGKLYTLNVYENTELKSREGFADYLFLPFTDLTNGEESYAGGRYIDLRIPKGDSILVDFNRAYNPYCAYNSRYSCPIPPPENFLEIPIPAGVKAFGEHE